MGFTSGPLVNDAQAHVRALTPEDNIVDILDEARRMYGPIAFSYRRGDEINISPEHGEELFNLLDEAYLNNVLVLVTGKLVYAEIMARDLLEDLEAIQPRQEDEVAPPRPTTQTKSTLFDFGKLSPPKPKNFKRIGPGHFMYGEEHENDNNHASRIFSSSAADPEKWYSNHCILQNLTKKDILSLRLLKKPHLMVVRAIEIIAILTGRRPANKPMVLFSIIAPLVLTDDLLTELLLLQQDMIPTNDLRKVKNLLKLIDVEELRRINFTAGCLIDWARAVALNIYPSSSDKTYKHAIFSRTKPDSGLECIPVKSPWKSQKRKGRVVRERPVSVMERKGYSSMPLESIMECNVANMNSMRRCSSRPELRRSGKREF